MAKIEFASVGVQLDTAVKTQTTGSLLPLGFKTPLQFGVDAEGIFAMYFTFEKQLEDNFRNLLYTNHGERLGLYDFGANLRPLTTELNSQDNFDATAIQNIKAATSKYMPFLSLKTFESTIDRFNNQHVGKIIIKVIYDIPLLNLIDKEMDVTLYVI